MDVAIEALLSDEAESENRNRNSVAVVGVITQLQPIAGADLIQLAIVDCGDAGTWSGVVGKAIQANEVVTVFLQDALLPANERWAFMSRHHWRVRMARFKGCASECVIIQGAPDMAPGTCLMEALGVTKYEKPLPATLTGDACGNFPSFIPKTDEPNWQRVRDLALAMAGGWYATEKADGTSCTAFIHNGELRVCSRNLELREFNAHGAGNIYWRMARQYGLEAMTEALALQFEIVGPGVQGNPMGLAANEIRVFTAHNHATQNRLPYEMLLDICLILGLPTARLVTMGHGPLDADALRKLAEIKYPNGKPGEGIVIRDLESRHSLKVINLLYKD